MAKKTNDRVRLPELPIFKKYSLALRQEFASPKELLTALDRTTKKVETFLDKAENQRDIGAETPTLEEVPEAELKSSAVEEASDAQLASSEVEEISEVKSAELEAERSAADPELPQQEVELLDLEATTELESAGSESSEKPESHAEPEEPEFRLLDELAEDEGTDPELDDRPIWEPEPPARPTRVRTSVPKAPAPKVKRQSGSRTVPRTGSPARKRTAAKTRATKSNKKRRQMRPEIVRVSSRGTPIKSRAARRTTGRKRSR